MLNLGEFDGSAMVDFKFTSRDDTGSPTTLAGSPAVLVYKSNSTTESASTGITLTVDFDSRTGLNHVRIDTSANTSFFATANDFDVVITAGTVGGVSVVGETIAHFSIRNRAGLLPTTAGRTLTVDAAGLADANMVKAGPSGSGTAQTTGDIYGILTTVASDAMYANSQSYAAASYGADILTVLGTPSITIASDILNLALTVSGIEATLGTPATTSISADILALQGDTTIIKGKTDNLPASPASTTNITAASGVVLAATTHTGAVIPLVTTTTTATNVTNAPTNGDLTAAMKASVTTAATAATPSVTVSDKTGFALTAGERTSIGTAVWATGTRTLTSFGTLIADIWASATRTLTDIPAALLALFFTRNSTKVYGDAVNGSVVKEIVSNTSSGGGGGGGLTAQQTRDAMALALTVGTTINSGSLDGRIIALTQAAFTVNVVSPVATNGDIELTRGDDYLAADGWSVDFDFTGLPDLTGAAAVLNVLNSARDIIATYNGSIANPAANPTISVDITHAQTSALILSGYTYALKITLSNSHEITPATGNVVMYPRP